MIIFLIGFMGSGKTTTGKRLARELGYKFLDTDSEIVKSFGMSINAIFRDFGEKVFREAETGQLERIMKLEDMVVSTGGGLPCYNENMDRMKSIGKTVYLKAGPDTLFQRLAARKFKRPLIKDLSDEELRQFIEGKLAEREVYYNQAEIVVEGINTDVDEIIAGLNI